MSKEKATLGFEYERKARKFQDDGDVENAFEAFDQAARYYREASESLKAALCFSAAATCWNIFTGTQPLRKAATRNHEAAKEAMKVHNYDYARTLFREAALLYEKEGDYENYSECFVESQKAGRKRSWVIFCGHREQGFLNSEQNSVSARERIAHFFRYFANLHSDFIWGYGEKPFRTLGVIAFVILFCAAIYSLSGYVLFAGRQHSIGFFESIYFSVETFSTLGYGDFAPMGWTRLVVVFEVLSGILLMPLFLIGLTRRYLRMYQ